MECAECSARAELDRPGDAFLGIERLDDGLRVRAKQTRIVADQAAQRHARGQVGPLLVFKGFDLTGGELDPAGHFVHRPALGFAQRAQRRADLSSTGRGRLGHRCGSQFLRHACTCLIGMVWRCAALRSVIRVRSRTSRPVGRKRHQCRLPCLAHRRDDARVHQALREDFHTRRRRALQARLGERVERDQVELAAHQSCKLDQFLGVLVGVIDAVQHAVFKSDEVARRMRQIALASGQQLLQRVFLVQRHEFVAQRR